MYTLCSNYYMEHAVFREDTFYLIPAAQTPDVWLEGQHKAPRIFHWCPELSKRSGDKVGIVFLKDHVENMKCDRCHKRPGPDITTVWTLLKGT
jgi:hypothetical protein